METDHDLEFTLKKLEENVEEYRVEKSRYLGNSKFWLFSSLNVYIIIPVLVLLFLLIFRPEFILYEKEGEKHKRISYKKLFLYFLALSFILIMGMYGYNYSQRGNSV